MQTQATFTMQVAFPPPIVIYKVAKEVVDFANELKNLFGSNPAIALSDKLDHIVAQLDHIEKNAR